MTQKTQYFTYTADADVVHEIPKGEVHVVIMEGNGNATLTVTGEGEGDAVREGAGNGHAIRDGKGDGDAIRRGEGKGIAYRRGSGSGDAAHEGAGEGNAYRGGSGNGDAIRQGDGYGVALRSGEGKGNAIRKGAGDGKALRIGTGDGRQLCMAKPDFIEGTNLPAEGATAQAAAVYTSKRNRLGGLGLLRDRILEEHDNLDINQVPVVAVGRFTVALDVPAYSPSEAEIKLQSARTAGLDARLMSVRNFKSAYRGARY